MHLLKVEGGAAEWLVFGVAAHLAQPAAMGEGVDAAVGQEVALDVQPAQPETRNQHTHQPWVRSCTFMEARRGGRRGEEMRRGERRGVEVDVDVEEGGFQRWRVELQRTVCAGGERRGEEPGAGERGWDDRI